MTDLIKELMDHTAYQVKVEHKINTISIDVLEKKITNLKDVILYGPPGTGKSFMVDSVMRRLGEKFGHTKKIQFHSEYTYDDFVEGLVPKEGEGIFEYHSGAFFKFCEEVEKTDPDLKKIHPFFIDEINRANITSVFGEVLYLIEDKGIRTLATSKRNIPFTIPKNVIIIGTMNTADKSLSRLDFALRRRFSFLPVYPDDNVLREVVLSMGFSEDLESKITIDSYVDAFNSLNAQINAHPLLGKDLTIGHVLWIPKVESVRSITEEDIGDVFREYVFPQLESYCGSNKEALGVLIGPRLRDSIVFGKYISDLEVLAYLNSQKNSQAGEAT